MFFRHVGADDGINSLRINCIAQDADGFIWIGTPEGLVKYYGQTGRVYKNQVNDPSSLSNDEVLGILSDSRGHLWIGTMDGLNLYDKDHDCFIVFRKQGQDSSSLGNSMVRIIFETKKGDLYVGHYDGFARMIVNANDPSKTKFINRHFFEIKDRIEINDANWSRNDVGAMCEDADGCIWIGTWRKGIYKYDPLHDKLKDYSVYKKKETRCSRILRDSENTIWFAGYEGEGLYVYDRSGDSLRNIKISNIKAGNSINGFIEDDQKRLRIVTEDGMRIVDLRTEQPVAFPGNEENSHTICHNSLTTVFTDRSNTTWIGSNDKGLFYISSKEILIEPVVSLQAKSRQLLNAGHDKIFVFDHNLQVHQLSRTSHKYSDLVLQSSVNFNANPDHEGNIFFNETGEYYSLKDRCVKKMDIHRPVMTGAEIQALSTDRKGNVFCKFNQSDEAGIYLKKENKYYDIILKDRYNPQRTLQITDYSRSINDTLYFLDKTAVYQLEDYSGNLKQILSASDIPGFSFNFEKFILDRNGNYFLLAYDKIYFFCPASRTVKLVVDNTESGKISSMVLDNNNDLWYASVKGITCYKKQENKFYLYDKSDGISGNGFTGLSCSDSSGYLYFSTLEGILIINPAITHSNAFVPPVVFTGFRLFNKTVGINKEAEKFSLEKSINEMKEIVLRHDQNFITIEFAALSYKQSEKNQYAFYLDGLEDEWHYAGTNRTAVYNGLAPGTYVFRVKASNNSGVWNEEGRSLRIVILPPFWQQWWFIVSMALLLLFGAWSYYRYRLRSLEHQKIVLEKKVKERTAEVVAQKEEINAQADNLKEINVLLEERNEEVQVQADELAQLNATKDKFFSIIAHDLKNPFQAITGLSELLLTEYEQYDVAKVKGFITMIHASSTSASNLLINLLQWARSQTSSIKIKPELFNLHGLVRDVFMLLSSNANDKQVSLQNLVPLNTGLFADRNMINTVIRNLVNNAIKYTPENGIIKVSAAEENNKLIIRVSDNGVGMNAETCSGLFRIDKHISTPGTKGEAGTGLGLIICKDFIEKHGGSIRVESEQGRGTHFIIQMNPAEDIRFDDSAPTQVDIEKSEVRSVQIEEVKTTDENVSAAENENNSDDLPLLLVVDDDEKIRVSIISYFSKSYRIIAADNGKKGLDVALNECPDLIAVSYTHLDVYKRQIKKQRNFRWRKASMR